ncbi:unnamed protein product [Sphagnum tenellum]
MTSTGSAISEPCHRPQLSQQLADHDEPGLPGMMMLPACLHPNSHDATADEPDAVPLELQLELGGHAANGRHLTWRSGSIMNGVNLAFVYISTPLIQVYVNLTKPPLPQQERVVQHRVPYFQRD